MFKARKKRRRMKGEKQKRNWIEKWDVKLKLN